MDFVVIMTILMQAIGVICGTQQLCSSTPSGLFRIEEPKNAEINIDVKTVTARMKYITMPIKATVTKLKRFKSHCTAQFDPSQYEDCYPGTTKEIRMDDDEVRATIKDKKCFITAHCPLPKGCMAKSSSWCLTEERKQRISPNRMGPSGYRVSAFHEGCILDWDCVIREIEINPKAVFDPSHVGFEFTGENGATHFIEHDPDTIYKDGDYYVKLDNYEIKETLFEAKCIRSGHRVICMSTEDKEAVRKGDSFLVDTNGFSGMENMLVHVSLVSEEEVSHSKAGASSSIEGVWETMNSMLFAQSQSLYNTLVLNKDLNMLKKTVIQIIKMMDKEKGTVVSTVLNATFSTKWFSEDIFMIYPCTKSHDRGERCRREWCDFNATTIPIFGVSDLLLDLLSIPRMEQAESEKWKEKIDEIERDVKIQNDNNEKTAVVELDSVKSWIVGTISNIAIIAGVVGFLLHFVRPVRSMTFVKQPPVSFELSNLPGCSN